MARQINRGAEGRCLVYLARLNKEPPSPIL